MHLGGESNIKNSGRVDNDQRGNIHQDLDQPVYGDCQELVIGRGRNGQRLRSPDIEYSFRSPDEYCAPCSYDFERNNFSPNAVLEEPSLATQILTNPNYEPNFFDQFKSFANYQGNNYFSNNLSCSGIETPPRPLLPRIATQDGQRDNNHTGEPSFPLDSNVPHLINMVEQLPTYIISNRQYENSFQNALTSFEPLNSNGEQTVLDIFESGSLFFRFNEEVYGAILNSRDILLQIENESNRISNMRWRDGREHELAALNDLVQQQSQVMERRVGIWEDSIQTFEATILRRRFGILDNGETLDSLRQRLSSEEAAYFAEQFEEYHSPRYAQSYYQIAARNAENQGDRMWYNLQSIQYDVDSNNIPRIRDAIRQLESMRSSLRTQLENARPDDQEGTAAADSLQRLHEVDALNWGLLYESYNFLYYSSTSLNNSNWLFNNVVRPFLRLVEGVACYLGFGRLQTRSETEFYADKILELERERDGIVSQRSGISRIEAEQRARNLQRIVSVYTARGGRISQAQNPEEAANLFHELKGRILTSFNLVQSYMNTSRNNGIYEDFSDAVFLTFVSGPQRAGFHQAAIQNLRFIEGIANQSCPLDPISSDDSDNMSSDEEFFGSLQNQTELIPCTTGPFNSEELQALLINEDERRIIDITDSDSYEMRVEELRESNPDLFALNASENDSSTLASLNHPSR